MKYTYYEVKGTIDGEEEILFGSYEKSDCTSEKRIEGECWKDEGYRKIRITSTPTTTPPDPEIYS